MTAVEWLLEQIDDIYIHQVYNKEFNQAKELEKQQIIDANNAGYKVGRKDIKFETAEQYYHETYEG